MSVHPSAVVDPSASVGDGTEIGPFCVVGPGVRLGPGNRLIARVRIAGPVGIGTGNVFHPTAVVGGDPQDLQPAAPDGRIEIGDGNVFREGTTVNLPKMPGGVTRIGSRNRFHYTSHVGHDCTLGNDVILCTYAVLGGHSAVQDGAWVEGLGGTHQFVTVGRGAWTRSHIPITEDVPPYMWVDGNHFEVKGVHPRHQSPALQNAFEVVWKSGLPRPEALKRLERDPDPKVAELVEFLRWSARGRFGRGGEARRG